MAAKRKTNGVAPAVQDADQKRRLPDDETGGEQVSEGAVGGGTHDEQRLWQKSLKDALHAVVSIRFSQTAAFDTEDAGASEATGFVVDSQLGIVLTNRHVVSPGPWTGEAVFHDHEEAVLRPVYRDPVHDFGFLRFNPADIKYMTVGEIPLAPEEARVGIDVKVVGNDNGEKLSILSGSLSRLDRNAPVYGDLTYNDFNTFYLQAASSTSGGSSGSPVLNVHGKAVALQAGGATRAATDFFLPLDRVKRALDYVRNGITKVPRGTIQTQFLHKPFDEARRLGLTPETEARVRKERPDDIGMLVVEVVVPKSPAFGLLEEGDVLVSIDGKIVTHFVTLEAAFDKFFETTSYDKKVKKGGKETPAKRSKTSTDTTTGNLSVKILVERGGQPLELDVPVVDLHSITPDRFVSVGGGILNNVSYQLARQLCAPREGVYVANPSGMFVFSGSEFGWVVTNVDGKPTRDLDEFITVMKDIPDKKRVSIHYHSILDLHNKCVTVVSNERHWSNFSLSVRNDETGIWDVTDLGDAPPPVEPEPITVSFPDYAEGLGHSRDLFKALVKVNSYVPITHSGMPYKSIVSCGIILDKELGLVIVNHTVVSTTTCDITITIADLITVYAKPIFIHPTQNFSIIQYNPESVGETPVVQIPISDKKIKQGAQCTLVVLRKNTRPTSVKTTVTDVLEVSIPCSPVPRFRPINMDAIMVDTPIASQNIGGVLADDDGLVQAIQFSALGERGAKSNTEYSFAIDIKVILPILETIREAAKLKKKATSQKAIRAIELEKDLRESVNLKGLALEVSAIKMSKAKHLGVTIEWIKKLEETNRERRVFFLVQRTEVGSKTAEFIEENDVILSINGKMVTTLDQFELSKDWPDMVEILVIRDMKEVTLKVPITTFEQEEVTKLVVFAGAVLQAPYRAALQQTTKLPSKIFISGIAKGSPSAMYGMMATGFITAINSKQVETLDDLVEAVKEIKSGTYVRIKIVTFDMFPMVVTVKMISHYWPTVVYERDDTQDCGWKHVSFDGSEEKKAI